MKNTPIFLAGATLFLVALTLGCQHDTRDLHQQSLSNPRKYDLPDVTIIVRPVDSGRDAIFVW